MIETAKVVHIITDLDIGGAEMVLYRLLRGSSEHISDVAVISLRGDGEVGGLIRNLGVSLHALNLGSGVGQLAGIRKVRNLLTEMRPSLVQTWMYHADLIGGLGTRRLRIPVVWGVHSGPPPGGLKGMWMRVALLAFGLLSRRITARIICCSQESFDVHRGFAYPPGKMTVVRNGFESLTCDRALARRSISAELNIPEDEPIIIRVGRYHPQKDHATMLSAFERVIGAGIPAHLVLVGDGMDPRNDFFRDTLQNPITRARIHLLGARGDVSKLLAGSDVSVSSSSFGEGLPLVLGESMSVGTPVVATDVGDSMSMIDDSERVTPPRDPQSLAIALARVLRLTQAERNELGEKDRGRVSELYSIESMIEGYLDVYREVLAEKGSNVAQ